MLDFLTENWKLLEEHTAEFVVFGLLSAGVGAALAALIRSAQVDVMRERIDAKDDQISRLKNDVVNLEEIPKLREEVASMRLKLDQSRDTDNVGAFEKALSDSGRRSTEEIDPVIFIQSLFDKQPIENIDEALKEAKFNQKPVFAIVYKRDHPSKSKLKYSGGYFLEYETTRRLISENFVVALLSNDAQEVAKLIPNDDPLENARLIILDTDGRIILSEGVYANPDEGLKRTQQAVSKLRTIA